MIPISYLQTDTKWANKDYSAKGETTTIGKSGCGPTAAAMVIASLADSTVTPAVTAKWSLDHGYKALRQGTYYSYFSPQMAAYAIDCQQINGSTVYHGAGSAATVNKKILDSVKAGNWAIVCMGPGDWTSSGHFILWYGVDAAGYALIMDPNSQKESRCRAKVSTMQYQAKYYFEVKVPSGEKSGENAANIAEEIMNDNGKFVIDVSKHNGTVDWSQVKVDGVLMKLGYRGYETGKLNVDPKYNDNVQGCVKNNLAFGAYWFTTAVNEKEAEEEAEFVLATIKGLKLWYPIFVDSEYSNDRRDGRSDSLSKAQRTACIRSFCGRIQSAGYTAGIYASESWFKEKLDVDQLPYRKWVANYSRKPTYCNYDGWQRTNEGTVNGISGDVDVSAWYSERVIYDPLTGKSLEEPEYNAAVSADPEPVDPDPKQDEARKEEAAAYQPAEWSAEAREWAVSTGLIKGQGGPVDWGSTITLERLATILYRLSKA